MVRAATWLHFGSGGWPALRASTTETSTPRQARSMASVRPTGPAPTIRTLQSGMASLAFLLFVANHNNRPNDIAKGRKSDLPFRFYLGEFAAVQQPMSPA